MKRLRRILHPTDFSPASGPALARAIELAAANRAELVIVHVLATPVPMVGEGYVSPRLFEEMEAANRAQGQKLLGRVLARARARGARVRGMLLDGGLPHEQIGRAARRLRADMVVMGTHGRTGVARFFLGSVAERVITTAPCPVLTVRGR
jgi:nucleotide-binding universal stress UspA family protein